MRFQIEKSELQRELGFIQPIVERKRNSGIPVLTSVLFYARSRTGDTRRAAGTT